MKLVLGATRGYTVPVRQDGHAAILCLALISDLIEAALSV
jgi:hypothetical protein